MTRNDTTRNAADASTEPKSTLGDVSHTHPYTKRSFGANFTFARGGAVAADGGRPDVVPEEGEAEESDSDDEPAASDDDEVATLGDVAHVPPDGHGANPVFERGFEGHDAADRPTSRRGGQVASDD